MKKFLAILLVLVFALSFAACAAKKTIDIGNADRARVFYSKYCDYVEKYGEGKEIDGDLYGVAVVRLMDFTGDAAPELLMAYSSEKDAKVDSVMVCGFDMGYAELLNEKITSKPYEGAEGLSLWLYTDSRDLSYIIKGEDLSVGCSYHTYQQADEDGKPLYDFAEAFATEGKDLSGTYDKIELSNCDNWKEISESNDVALSSMEAQKN